MILKPKKNLKKLLKHMMFYLIKTKDVIMIPMGRRMEWVILLVVKAVLIWMTFSTHFLVGVILILGPVLDNTIEAPILELILD